MARTLQLTLGAALLASHFWAALAPATAQTAPILRWEEGQPGCTFSADDDGRYRYGLWMPDFGILLAIDSQELQKANRRTEPVFAALLTLRYRGQDSLSVDPRALTLEFVKHSHDLHTALNPDELAVRFQASADRFGQTTQHQLKKHPEKKAEFEAELSEEQKSVADMLVFLKTRSLRRAELDSAHPETSGWVYFSATSKWIGDWKKQEEFVLRVPFAGQTIEFPFFLPPSANDLRLRRR